jgi:hypothetical protein
MDVIAISAIAAAVVAVLLILIVLGASLRRTVGVGLVTKRVGRKTEATSSSPSRARPATRPTC